MESLYKPFFDKFQPELLAIANSDAGRALFQIPGKEKVVKLSPNSFHVQKDKNLFKATFRCYDLYSAIVTGGLPSKHIKAEKDLLPFISRRSHSMQPYFHLPLAAVNSYFSGAGDGHVYLITSAGAGSEGAWIAVRDAATGSNVDYTSNNCYAMINQNGGGSTVVARSFFPTNTDSLTNGVKVESAIFSAYGYANYSDTDGKGVQMIETTQASTSQLVLADYSAIIKTAVSDTNNLLHLTNVAYNTWPLNAYGLTKINRTGFTKFGLIGSVDLPNNTTTGPVCGHSVYTSEATGTANDPYLAVTYSYFGGSIL